MVNQLLINDNLKSFVEGLDISQEQKDSLLLKIPQLDKKERAELLGVLSEIYLLNKEEEKTIEDTKANWQE